jgi:hypothetical protein
LVQIHLIGVVLAVAIGLLLLWCRPRLPWTALLLGTALAILSTLPYFLAGHLSLPEGNRMGYQHFWRVIPGAAMSLTGVGWQLEFRAGYPAFAEALGWRRWAYDAIMILPILLFMIGLLMGVKKLWRERSEASASRRSPLMIVIALVVLVPSSFSLLGLRTSPTYLPIWYPLPFALMGWTMIRFSATRRRRWLGFAMIAVLAVQLAFFGEQLAYMRRNGGVPGSLIGRSLAGMRQDVAELASQVDASEVWLSYDGPSIIQDEPAAYLLRRASWAGQTPRRVLVHFAWWRRSYDDSEIVQVLGRGEPPPNDAFLVRPWTGPQQVNSEIPHRP